MSKSKQSGNGNDDYEVGYKKPPEATRFQKGQSGNPKGRPKKDKSIKKLLQRALDTEITYNKEGERKKGTKRELIFEQLVNCAVKGEAKARSEVMALLRTFESTAPVSDLESSGLSCSPEEQRILDNFLARLQPGEQSDQPPTQSAEEGDHG